MALTLTGVTPQATGTPLAANYRPGVAAKALAKAVSEGPSAGLPAVPPPGGAVASRRGTGPAPVRAGNAGHPVVLEDRVVGEALGFSSPSERSTQPGGKGWATKAVPRRVGSGGVVATFGDARPKGAPGASGRELVALAASPKGEGYWAVDKDGAVFAYGAAHFYGSLLGHHPAGGIVSIAPTPDGGGYWLTSRDGDVFSFGDAHFYQSLGREHLGSPVVGMAATPNGHGYWLATAQGGVYSFGDAKFFGSLGNGHLTAHVVGIAAAPKGHGYWLASAGGGVFSFGEAKFCGSLGGSRGAAKAHLSAIASNRRGDGYWLLSTDGAVHAFGSARALGSARTEGHVEASAIAPTPSGHGYFLATSPGAPPSATAPESDRSLHAAEQVPARLYLGTFMITCYDLTGVTASGDMAGPESAAVDPGVIPLGSRIYVDGIGERTADDTGGAIIGNHIDIWEPSYAQCVDWGVQERSVYRLP